MNNENKWLEEFQEFINTPNGNPPAETSDRILNRVQSELNPPQWLVFSKLTLIHTLTGFLSLAICDQFGITPFDTGFSLSDYFMKFGHDICMLLCGFLFVNLSVLAAKLSLKKEEFNVFGKHAVLHIALISIVSLLVFWIAGADLFLKISILWLLGAFIGGLAPILIMAF